MKKQTGWNLQAANDCLGLLFDGNFPNIAYFGQEGYHEQPRWTKDFLQDEERETD